MILNFLFKKPETEEQFIIRWADTLIENSDSNGELDTTGFALDYHLSTFSEFEERKARYNPSNPFRDKILSSVKQPDADTVNFDIVVKELLKYHSQVENFLLKEDYIKTPTFDKKWALTEKGKLAKELGGHKAYRKYRKSEIELITNQGLINKLLIAATVLAAVMPFLAAWLFSTKVYNTNVLPKQNLEVHIDSSYLQRLVDDELKKIESNRQHKSTTSDTMPK